MDIYDEGIAQLNGAGDYLTDTVKAYVATSGYSFDKTHSLSDLTSASATLGTAVTLSGKSLTGGVMSATNPTWTDVPASSTVSQVIFTVTVSATEYLLCRDDVVDYETDGSNIDYIIDATNGLINFTGGQAITAPNVPTSVGTTAGDTEIDVGWVAPTVTGGAAITDYLVQYRTAANANLNILMVGNLATPATADDTLRQVFTNRGDAVTMVADDDAVPSFTGYDLIVVSESVNSASLSSTYLTSSTPCLCLEAYAADAAGWVSADPTSGSRADVYYLTGAEVAWTDQTPGTTVTAAPAAVNLFRNSNTFGAGFSPLLAWSSSDQSDILAGTYESGDTMQTGTASARYALFALGENAYETMDAAIQQLIYDLADWCANISTSSAGSWTTFPDGTSTATATTITGLTNGTGYDVRVAAVNSAGTSSWTTEVGPTTPTAASTGGGTPSAGGAFDTVLQANHYNSGTAFDISNVPQSEIDWMDTVVSNAQATAAITPTGANGIYRNNGGTETISGPTLIPRVGADGIKIERSSTTTVEDAFWEGPISLNSSVHSDGLQVSFAGGAGQAHCNLTRVVLNCVSQNEVHGQGIKTGDGALGGGTYTDVAIIGGFYPIRLNNSGTYSFNNVWLFSARAILPYGGYSTYDDVSDSEYLIISSGATISAFDVKVVNHDGTVRRLAANGTFSAYP